MKINVLVLDDVFDLGLSAVLDVFQTTNELIGMSGLTVPLFEVKLNSPLPTVPNSAAKFEVCNANSCTVSTDGCDSSDDEMTLQSRQIQSRRGNSGCRDARAP